MTIKELKLLIKNLPDDALVVTSQLDTVYPVRASTIALSKNLTIKENGDHNALYVGKV